MQIFDLTCLSLTSITFERIELESSDWTQKSRFFQLYPNMLSVHFDIILICLFSEEIRRSASKDRHLSFRGDEKIDEKNSFLVLEIVHIALFILCHREENAKNFFFQFF